MRFLLLAAIILTACARPDCGEALKRERITNAELRDEISRLQRERASLQQMLDDIQSAALRGEPKTKTTP